MKLRPSRVFQKSVVVIYWIALPLCLFTCVASFATIAPDGAYSPSWGLAFGSAVLGGLIGWRLWLNARALGHRGERPTLNNLLLVLLPLSLLALVGVALVLLGMVWSGLGLWMALQPTTADSLLIYPDGLMDGRSTGALMAGLGLLVLLAGVGLNVPLLRLLVRRRVETPSPADPAPLDTIP